MKRADGMWMWMDECNGLVELNRWVGGRAPRVSYSLKSLFVVREKREGRESE